MSATSHSSNFARGMIHSYNDGGALRFGERQREFRLDCGDVQLDRFPRKTCVVRGCFVSGMGGQSRLFWLD